MLRSHRSITVMFGAVGVLCGSPETLTAQFEFAGLSPRTSLEDLRSRYPSSYFDRRSVRVVPDDVHDHIYFIAVNADIGTLRLSFESPSQYVQNLPTDWAAQHRARQPLCAPILGRLTEAYGAPNSERQWSEEALEHLTRFWFTEDEQLVFDCYQPGATGDLLASDIRICPRQPVIRPQRPCT